MHLQPLCLGFCSTCERDLLCRHSVRTCLALAGSGLQMAGSHRPPTARKLEDHRILMFELPQLAAVVSNPEDPDGSSALYPLVPSSTSAPAPTLLNRDKNELCQRLLTQ